jgi:proteic killer suppression protein
MIVSIRHKGLKRLYESDDPRGLNPQHAGKIALVLGVLDVASTIDEINIPSFRLHPLTADLKGFWSVTIRANWRIIFRFEDGNVFDLDLVDYH